MIIELTKNQQAIVDIDDYKTISQYSWFFNKGGYAETVDSKNNRKHYLMHRFIMSSPRNKEVDHINGNKLDNRKINLRHCTRQENGRNVTKKTGTSSVYKGVSLNIQRGKYKYWFAAIKKDKKAYSIGTFKTEIQAAMAYDIWAKELFGEFAKLNFPNAIHGF